MSVASVNGSPHGHHAHKSKHNVHRHEKDDSKSHKSSHNKSHKAKHDDHQKSKTTIRDELSLSGKGHALGHNKSKDHVANNVTNNNTDVTNNVTNITNNVTNNHVTNNNITVNNYYGSGGEATSDSPTINVAAPDLSELTERLDTLANKLDSLGGTLSEFKDLVLNFERSVAEPATGATTAVVRGGLQGGGGLSFDNYNFALSFARKGFNIIDILQSSGGSNRSELSSLSDSLNRSLESLQSQSKNLLAEKNAVSGLFSNNLGTAVNQAV